MDKIKRKVLHIAPHLGGGVGRFFANILKVDTRYSHEFLLLEEPHNSNYLNLVGISWRIWRGSSDCLENYTEDCDLIEIDFWNHPALMLFMFQHRIDFLPVVLYSFVSGNAAPNYIPNEVIEYADWVILPGPSALQNSALVSRLQSYSVVFALGGISRTENLKKKAHSKLNVSYVGTAGSEKLHSKFSWACRKILEKFPSTQFRFASNDSNDHLQTQATNFGILQNFEFRTAVEDIAEFHTTSDIFGYPLDPSHYGTGEQALLEAMGAGIPPVVLNNPPERQLVHDGETGLIAADICEYVDLVCFLISEKKFRDLLSANAKQYAEKNFSANITVSKLNDVYDKVVTIQRKSRGLEMQVNSSAHLGWEIFKLGIGSDSPAILYVSAETECQREYWKLKSRRLKYLFSNVKGGLGQYLRYFPQDKNLNYLFKSLVT